MSLGLFGPTVYILGARCSKAMKSQTSYSEGMFKLGAGARVALTTSPSTQMRLCSAEASSN